MPFGGGLFTQELGCRRASGAVLHASKLSWQKGEHLVAGCLPRELLKGLSIEVVSHEHHTSAWQPMQCDSCLQDVIILQHVGNAAANAATHYEHCVIALCWGAVSCPTIHEAVLLAGHDATYAGMWSWQTQVDQTSLEAWSQTAADQ